MSVQHRKLVNGDFFPWLGLYEQYGEHYGTPINDQVALRVWSWIESGELDGLIAVDDAGSLVGFAHYRRFVQPLTARRGVFLEDLFVVPSERSHGVARALVDAVTAEAKAGGASLLQLSARPDDELANGVYGAIAERSAWHSYETAI
ncbi:GNAT family N-acetyltransferase [Microbacteriaceae bacterium VKM Ac-2854]|nr:GNAT family N-acetyltransferase [Microbacteriaceae bacterium VKM Ac-2854]